MCLFDVCDLDPSDARLSARLSATLYLFLFGRLHFPSLHDNMKRNENLGKDVSMQICGCKTIFGLISNTSSIVRV